ncbi:MmgE/PrpD family protein [Variovorax sp. LjRoot178]|uniref:MmgE/PrpD family protein n=1 Tax=Variovorax sp. LjRoot178 TaxID=3342277 RepID=UPI003ECFCB5B
MSQDIVHDFARAIADSRYEALSPAAIDAAKKSILDTFGCILAASGTEPAARRVADVARENGGYPQSTVLGFGGKLPAAWAAFANGAMAHCLDFDDRTPWGAHAGSSLMPAAFALAEARGGISGKQMIAAIAAAQDLFVRLRCNVSWRQDWNLSNVLGAITAAGAASHVLGLGREQVTHALGIASMHSAGTMELIFGTGSDLRGIYAAFSAKGAVLAALMAEKGISGIGNLFEGKAGLFKVYFADDYNRDQMLAGLGSDHLGEGMLYKPWPAVGISHTYIHAAIELMKEHALQPEQVERIEAFVGDFQKEMSYPLESRRAPGSAVDAKFSLPFVVAVAVCQGNVGVADFSLQALKDPRVLAMAQRVVPVEDSSADWKDKSPVGRVRIVTRDGRSFERLGDKVPGSPDAPLNWGHLAAKFRGCARAAAVPMVDERIDAAIRLAREFDSLPDVAEFIRALG